MHSLPATLGRTIKDSVKNKEFSETATTSPTIQLIRNMSVLIDNMEWLFSTVLHVLDTLSILVSK